jgi:hypothetical protein
MASAGDESCSLPLEDLQGEWIASRGEFINVSGKDLLINGFPVAGGLKLTGDGKAVHGFSVYQLASQSTDSGQIAWQAGHQEILWRRSQQGEAKSLEAKMGARLHDRASTCGGQAFDVHSDAEAVCRLNALLDQWREPSLVRVRSCDICPDWTNRAQTGLSLDHVHYIATMISRTGFKSRRRGLRTQDGAHDVPVLIREGCTSALGGAALARWREVVAGNPRFPPFMLDGKEEFFCSLGNGHFSQALNLFRAEAPNLWTELPYLVHDDALREALEDGVESVVLSGEMPARDRRFVSEMLNKTHGGAWHVEADGRVRIEVSTTTDYSQFVALSKVLDAEELSCLVR